MSRIPNRHGGGAKTNLNGLQFEQTTSLNDALIKAGYNIQGNAVFLGNVEIGLSVPKNHLYTHFLEEKGIKYQNYNSKKWLPDEAFINLNNNTVYILEKKFQNTSGSVDEKLPNCDFKRKEYQKLCTPIGYSVEYIYIFNDWFKNRRYTDTLEYIKNCGCQYYYNEIPLNALGL